MYAIAIIRYRRPLDEVLTVLDEHRAYLKTLLEAGTLLASGPLSPRTREAPCSCGSPTKGISRRSTGSGTRIRT